jgi:AcrR family transcriptional regulator
MSSPPRTPAAHETALVGGVRRGRRRGPDGVRRRDQEVVDTSARLFYEKGYSETSMQEIADALGMLKGSIYYYIETKEDLLFRLLMQVHDDVDALLERTIARDGLEPLERLRRYVRCVVMYSTGNLPRMSVYYHELDHLSGERRETVFGRRRRHQDFVVGLIEAAQVDGTAGSTVEAGILRDFGFGAMIWIYRWYRPDGRHSPEAIADACADFVVNALRPT